MVSTSIPAAVPSTQHDIPPHMGHIPTRTSLEIPLFVGETVLSVERRNGLVITTTVKVEVEDKTPRPREDPASGSVATAPPPRALHALQSTVVASESTDELAYPSSDEDSTSDDSMVVIDSSAPPPPNPIRAGLPGLPMVPVPTELRCPTNNTVFAKYVVVFAGLRVGIFPRSMTELITRIVEGVPNARRKAFGNWDEALWHYAAAYQGVHPFRDGMHNKTPGYKPQILRFVAVDNPLATSYTFGNGPRVGQVDVQGLDLDADRLSYEVDLVPDA
ncbi:hypothetical protein V5O48_017967 [Marasmius crinis-equi]|uniref:Uncharacterized protein n=1 Tax=Marasmius crinis-equi TaxID=585013 RepID=A0ABR3EMH5_9AGAR